MQVSVEAGELAVEERSDRRALLALAGLALLLQPFLLIEVGFGSPEAVLPWFAVAMESFAGFAGASIVYLSFELSRIQRARSPLIVAAAFGAATVVSAVIVVGGATSSVLHQVIDSFSLAMGDLHRLGQYVLVVPLAFLPLAFARTSRHRDFLNYTLFSVSAFLVVVASVLWVAGALDSAGGQPIGLARDQVSYSFYFNSTMSALCVAAGVFNLRCFRSTSNRLLLASAILLLLVGLTLIVRVLPTSPFWLVTYLSRTTRLGGYVVFALILLGEYVRGYRQFAEVSRRMNRELEGKIQHLRTLMEENARLFERTAAMHEQLKVAGLRLEAVIDSMPEGVCIAEAPSGRVILANKAAERITGLVHKGLAPVEDHPVAFHLLKPTGEMLPPWEQPIYRSIHHREVCSGVEMDIESPAGKRITLLVNSAPIEDRQGRIVGAVVVFQDVTRKKAVERIKDDFLSLVSHDLKTPLTTIKGYASTLVQEDVTWSNVEQREFLRIIGHEADRLTRRVQDLLDVSAIASGALTISKAWCDVEDLIGVCLERLTDLIGEYLVVVDVEAGLPMVPVDSARIKQALTNLLDNAVRFSEKGTEIRIGARLVDGAVHISVSDHGVGIDPIDLPRVFDRFTQGRDAISRQPGGKGLGLAICQGIVEAHGGAIMVTSAPGVGSTFTFSLPVFDGGAPAD